MATITPLKHTPHTCIENSIIDNMAQIGVYGMLSTARSNAI